MRGGGSRPRPRLWRGGSRPRPRRLLLLLAVAVSRDSDRSDQSPRAGGDNHGHNREATFASLGRPRRRSWRAERELVVAVVERAVSRVFCVAFIELGVGFKLPAIEGVRPELPFRLGDFATMSGIIRPGGDARLARQLRTASAPPQQQPITGIPDIVRFKAL